MVILVWSKKPAVHFGPATLFGATAGDMQAGEDDAIHAAFRGRSSTEIAA
jgi:hypothetical protein